jgi:hypothetical protein
VGREDTDKVPTHGRDMLVVETETRAIKITYYSDQSQDENKTRLGVTVSHCLEALGSGCYVIWSDG